MTKTESTQSIKTIARNKKVFFNYFVEEKHEAGIVLTGSEVKSLRLGKASIDEAFVSIDDAGRLILKNAQIAEYPNAVHFGHEARRNRFLLMHKNEINRLAASVNRKGWTIMPLELYFSGKRVKCRIGLCCGKKQHDKRDVLRDRDVKKQMDHVQKKFNARGG